MQSTQMGGELSQASIMTLGKAKLEAQQRYYSICNEAKATFAGKGIAVRVPKTQSPKPLSLLQQHCALQDRGSIIILNVGYACFPKPDKGVELDDTTGTFLGAFLYAEAGPESTDGSDYKPRIFNRTNNEQLRNFQDCTKETFVPKVNEFLHMEEKEATEYVNALCTRLQTQLDTLKES